MPSRPFSAKPLALAGCSAVVLLAAVYHFTRQPEAPSSRASGATAPASSSVVRPDRVTLLRDLRSLLAEPDATRRQTRLRAWADSIGSELMASLLAELHVIDDPLLRNEARQALLYSWTSRDLVAVARWFGTFGPAYDLQQEGRDQLVLALLQCKPDDVLAALRSSLPPTTSQQLYGPYFRGWAATEPALAGAKLVALAQDEPGNPALWHDLISQVAAQWVETDTAAALAWVRALPDSPAKVKAELQTCYRWTELDPVAASAYAARAQNLQLVKTVAGKWAESNPAAALSWAQTLPEGIAQGRALSGVAATWAQTHPQAAATYAASLSQPVLRSDVIASVASTWAFSDSQAAGAWVKSLPADGSRDLAVGVLCESLRFNAPDQAFAWAGALTDPELRATTLASVAVVWLKQAPAAARAAITGSTLPEELKSNIFSQATPRTTGG
jgi:hypothetical protein